VNHTRSVTRVARRKRLAAPARRAHRPGLQCLSQSSLSLSLFRSGKETLTSRRRSGFRRPSFVPNENTRWRPYLVSAIQVNAPTVLTNDESPIPLSLSFSPLLGLPARHRVKTGVCCRTGYPLTLPAAAVSTSPRDILPLEGVSGRSRSRGSLVEG